MLDMNHPLAGKERALAPDSWAFSSRSSPLSWSSWVFGRRSLTSTYLLDMLGGEGYGGAWLEQSDSEGWMDADAAVGGEVTVRFLSPSPTAL